AAIVRENLEGARRTERTPPKRIVPCDDCGTPMAPVLFRPDGPWTWRCIKGCYACTGCRRVHRFDENCPCWHCPHCTVISKRGRSARPILPGKPCPNCGGRQGAVTVH